MGAAEGRAGAARLRAGTRAAVSAARRSRARGLPRSSSISRLAPFAPSTAVSGSMTKATHWIAWFAAALAALGFVASTAAAATNREFVRYSIAGSMRVALPLISPPPKLSGHQMLWYRWDPSARRLQGGRVGAFGSVAVLGLESMRDLESLRDTYGFHRVQVIPQLACREGERRSRAAAFAARKLGERSPHPLRRAGRTVRHSLGSQNDPLPRTVNPALGLPYEWQFDVSGVERALETARGGPRRSWLA